MARLNVRSGLGPGDPEVPVAVLVIDSDGTPGERALSSYSAFGHEGDQVSYLLQTDGWAEHSYTGERLAVDIALHPGGLERLGVDPADFPVRSSFDANYVLVLHAETTVDPAMAGQVWEGTAVFTSPGEDWPLVLAPPPEEPYGDEEEDDGPVKE
ncbi:hypothetical protein [Kitasatospora sp. NPDC057936]|uniref:hypothetical protein n=1 Tax=Kitasatospora sp. NPDC057936 TaxID=3346283 RepID=UPI0036D82C72